MKWNAIEIKWEERYIDPDCSPLFYSPTNLRGWCFSFYDGSFACLAEAEMKFAKCNDLAKKPQVQCLVSETAPKEVF